MNKKINVLYIFPNFSFIGAQRAAAATIRKLDRNVFEPNVCVIDAGSGMQTEFPTDVSIYKLPSSNFFSALRFFRIFYWPFALRRLIEKLRPNVVISICPQTNFTLVFYRILFGPDVMFIGEEHQHLTNAYTNDPNDFPFPWRWIYRFSLANYNKLDIIRCVSHAAADDFITNWGVEQSRIVSIYPAFDLERIRSRAHGVVRNNKIPVICSVGRLTSQKDFALLIRSFKLVIEKINCRLVIAGTGPQRGVLVDLIRTLKLENDVTLLGFVEYAEEVVASSDLFVMTSIWEGFPATLVESMSLGTPVLSLNCESGPGEIISNRHDGILIQERNPKIIASAIVELLTHSDFRHSLASNALETVKKFSLEANVKRFEGLLQSL